jgi:hypothetical protein
MSQNFEKVDIITRDRPPKKFNGAVTHRGQLYLDSSSGQYYRSLGAGRDVEWERVYLNNLDEMIDLFTREGPLKDLIETGGGGLRLVRTDEEGLYRVVEVGDV